MNLAESLEILHKNNYITEFLQTTIKLSKLINLLNNNFDYNFIEVEDTYHFGFINLKSDTSLTHEDFNKINAFIKKYGYTAVRFFKDTLLIEALNKLEINSEYKYFIHQSPVPPQIIMKSGLRTHSFNERLYLFAFKNDEELSSFCSSINSKDYPEEKEYSDKYEDAPITIRNKVYVDKTDDIPICFFYYMVNVSNNIKIHTDNEDMGDDLHNVYITQPIKPQDITYLGYE